MKTKLIALLTLLPALAQAHPGHGGHGFPAGLAHLIPDWDHALAMIAVGVLAARLWRRTLGRLRSRAARSRQSSSERPSPPQ